MSSTRLLIWLTGTLAIALPASALAAWQSNGQGQGYSIARSMPGGNQPTAIATGSSAAINWVQSSGGAPVSGYIVKRYGATGAEQAVGSGCSGVVSATSCIESGVPSGVWTYTVTPVNGNWRGAESPQSVAVTVGASRSLTTSAWDLRDASSGTEANASDATAFPNDSRTLTTGNFDSAFSSSRYLQLDYASPLPAGLAVSSASFDFRFRANGGSEVACFYFHVISAGVTLGTYGSTTPGGGSSQWCTTTTLKTVSTAISGITTTDIANGLRIRVYGYESNRKPIVVDQATISGTSADADFTLYAKSTVDASTGTAANSVVWPLMSAGDGAFYATASTWATSFSSSRYLRLAFPVYVPAGATITEASFKHSYRPASNVNACWYFEAYSGGTLLTAYGSASQPIGCHSSSSTWRTDTVSLSNAVTAAAQANNLSIRVYVSTSSAQRTQHDLAELSLTYMR